MSQIRRTYTRIVTHEIIRSEPSGSIPVGRCPLCGHETLPALPETGMQTSQPTHEQPERSGSITQPNQKEPPPTT
ncbi:MAG: hypothetical protein K1Y36_25460 [Blastocatellia bacterium]|nr:hypothetical protein [Blastocatellia bacterium]